MVFPVSSLPRFAKIAMAFPVSSLPRFAKIALASSHLYVSHDEDGSLKFREEKFDEIFFNQFELEEAKIGKGLLHIKSRTTNKYWVRAGPDSIFIKAAADKPNEDQLDPSCTLIQPVDIKGSSVYQPGIKFRLVHSNKLLCHCIPYGTSPAIPFLSLEKDEHSTLSHKIRFDVIDCGAMPVVPKHPYHSYRYVVLSCNYNKKYLQLTNKVDNGFADGSIRGDQEDALSPNCKFELERPNADNKRLCHIRSCYNNKYLTMEGGIIKAVASHPNPKPIKEDGSAQVEEDKEGYYHTLFELVHVADRRIQLRFVHSQRLVAYSQFTKSLFQPSEKEYVPYIQTELSVFNWEKFVILPKHVAFKGQNGKYLAARMGSKPRLRFNSNDIRDKEAAHEITYTPDGLSVCIKSHTGKFWNSEDGWIRAKDDSCESEDTLFVPIKTGANIVALRCVRSGLFCKEVTGSDHCLSANDETIDQFACLTVEERVYKREISNINFRLTDARIYDETIKTMVTRGASNHNSEKETVQLRLLYQHKTNHTFNGGFSMSQSIAAKFTCKVPFIAETGFKVALGFEQSFNWGKTTETTSDVETTHVVTVPEYSKVQVRLVATEGKCDVPFSYVIHDTLMSGTERTYEMFGGIYTGVSNYNFRYETVKLPLDHPQGLKSEGTALISKI